MINQAAMVLVDDDDDDGNYPSVGILIELNFNWKNDRIDIIELQCVKSTNSVCGGTGALEKGHNSFYDIWRGAYFAYSTPRRNEAIPSSFVTLSRCNNFLNAMICFTGSCNNDKDTAGELKMLPSVTHNVSKVTELSKCLCHCLCLCLCLFRV